MALQGADNQSRQAAETQLNSARTEHPTQLLQAFIDIVVAPSGDVNQQVYACMLLKKTYLDDRTEEKALQQLSEEQLQGLKQTIGSSINFDQPTNLLRRKAEVVCKLYKKSANYGELIQMLQSWASGNQVPGSADDAVSKAKVTAMYMFELLAEYHLPQELIVQESDSFMLVFNQGIQDADVKVRTATLRALTSFLCSIEDEDNVLKYQDMMSQLLDIVIEVLKTDEDQGQASI